MIQYHKCNETLRECFYTGSWGYQQCEPYSIFVSQATYPIKGFHFLLEALPSILNVYPQTHVYVSGVDITSTRRRLRTLGIPYLIWNSVATIFYILLEWRNTGSLPSLSGMFIIDCLFNNRYNGPLWYVQKLLIYSWIAPALYYVIRKRGGIHYPCPTDDTAFIYV